MSDKPVYRLLDIEVEEVSLVDRAANKHRFLIVKRSDMSEPAQEPEAAPEEAEVGAGNDVETDESDAEAEGDAADSDDDETPEGGQGGNSPPAIITAAVEALGKLTDAVEKLETAGADGAELRKAKGELRAVAELLAKAVAPKKPRRKPAAPPTDENEDEDEEAQAKSVLTEVRAALGQVQELLTRGAKPTARRPATKSDTAAKLDSVLERLDAIGGGLKEHTQRLSRLEKQSGLPNSAPVGERPERASEEEDAFWSFDLNRPTDRASVDRTVSFFEEPA